MSAKLTPAGENGPTRLTSQLISVLGAFVVPDVRATAEHYRDKLGFRLCWVLGEHPGQFGIVDFSEGQGIHLKSVDPSCSAATGRPPVRGAPGAGGGSATGAGHGAGPAPGAGCDMYIRVTDADVRHADLARRGARLLGPPRSTPQKQREFEVMDDNGFVLRFGSDIAGDWPGVVATEPVLAVTDVAATARCWRERFGFEVRTPGDPSQHAVAVRDDACVRFTRAASPSLIGSNAPTGLWDAYVECFGVTALHEELVARGADIVRGPVLAEYGNLELTVRDDDGHVICFAVLRDDVERGEG